MQWTQPGLLALHPPSKREGVECCFLQSSSPTLSEVKEQRSFTLRDCKILEKSGDFAIQRQKSCASFLLYLHEEDHLNRGCWLASHFPPYRPIGFAFSEDGHAAPTAVTRGMIVMEMLGSHSEEPCAV